MLGSRVFFVFCIISCHYAEKFSRTSSNRRNFLSRQIYVESKESKYRETCKNFRYISQNVDHFGFNNVDKYKQRYVFSDKYWKGSGSPIFFYTGNEGDIQWFCENTGFVWEIAPQFGAMVVFAEHRYYGNSMPYGNSSYDKVNIEYLTSEQALADYVYLIKYIKKTKSVDSPVIAFGGSYGGMLSAWIRMKYPHIVAGSLAASAPILQFVASCDSMDKVITNSFSRSDPLCPHIIQKSWNIINKMAQSEEGLKELTQIFKLCSPLKNSEELKSLLNDIYGNIAMANYPYAAGFLSPLPAWPVNVMCSKMVNGIDKNFDRDNIRMMTSIYEGINVYTNYTGKTNCIDVNSGESQFEMNSWTYQTCTEFVFPMCSTGKTDMFEYEEWNVSNYNQECQLNYKVIPKSEWPIYTLAGSLDDLKDYSNIIFSNGDLDPWYSGGVVKTVNERLPAIIIKNGAHHLDLRSANKNDPESVIEARSLEIKYITQWIQEHQDKF